MMAVVVVEDVEDVPVPVPVIMVIILPSHAVNKEGTLLFWSYRLSKTADAEGKIVDV